MNLSTNQGMQNVLVKQYQAINRRVQPTHTRMDLKERTREPSSTDSPGTGTGASHVASLRTTPASQGTFVPRTGRGPTMCEPGVIVSSILVA